MTSAAFWTEAKRLQTLELSLIRKVMECAPPNAINLALGELGFAMPDALKEQSVKLLYEGNPAYTPNAGLPELRARIGEVHNSQPEQIVITNGAEEAVFIALLATLNPGDVVAIPDPDYTAYSSIAAIFEAEVLRLPFEPDFQTIDWEKWEILLQRAKVLILSAPSNPSGFCFDEKSALRFAELVNRHSVIVIVDEIYARLWFEVTPTELSPFVDKLIRIGGLSKSHLLSGWRLGWIIAPPEMVPSLTKAKQYISTCSHWLSQKLAIFVLSQKGLELAEEVRLKLKANQDWLKEHFKSTLPKGINEIYFPTASPYVLMRTDDPFAYCSSAAQKGVIMVPGKAFGEVSKSHVRVNIGVEPTLLRQAFKLLA